MWETLWTNTLRCRPADRHKDGRDRWRDLVERIGTDAVLLDLLLPQLGGLAVLERLRQHPAWVNTPVVVLSALDAGSDLAQAFAAGASDYVTKPFNPEELLARLQRLLPNTWPTLMAGASAA